MEESVRMFDEGDRYTDIDLESLSKSIRIKYNIPEKFDKLFTYCNDRFISGLITKSFDVNFSSTYSYDLPEITPLSYTYDCNEFFIFSEYFKLLDKCFVVVFYSSEEKLKNKFLDIISNVSIDIGSYNLVYKNGIVGLEKCNISTESAPILDFNLEESLNNDINNFFNKKEFYKKNNLTYKRGILMYGPPGNGKTSFIKNLLKNHKDKYCLIIDCSNGFSTEFGPYINNHIKDGNKIIVLEDIDSISDYDKSSLLNFIDGISSPENMLIIATTNHLDKLDNAIVRRPSRFDKVYEIGLPSSKCRKMILENYFDIIDKNVLEECVKKTVNFSGAYLKEIFIQSTVDNICPLKVVNNMEKQVKSYSSYKSSKSYC